MRTILLFAVVVELSCPAGVQAAELVGRVLSVDAHPLARAIVTAQRIDTGRANELELSAAPTPDGAYALRELALGRYLVTYRAAGYTAARLHVDVPRSLTIALPPMRLAAECYARVRFVSTSGSRVSVSRVVGQSFDLDGMPLRNMPDTWTPTRAADDGAVMIGPLPRGMTVLGIDVPEFARTRLPDVRVSGVNPVVDLGTIVVRRGAALQVHVLDARGAPRQNVRVSVAEIAALTPFELVPVHTDAEGLATFDRLAAGTYRLAAEGDFACSTGTPGAERIVSVPADGAQEEALIVGGARVTLQLMRDGAPLIGIEAALEPVSVEPTWPPWWPSSERVALRMLPYPDEPRSLCTGSTDNSGRMSVSNVPFGPTRVVVFFSNASWSSGVVSIPVGGRALRVDLPSQAVTARVLRSDTGAAVPDSEISWDSSGSSVRARATAAGDVLLDGVPRGPGRLTISAEGFGSLDQNLAEVPAGPLEFRLIPIAPPGVVVRVSDDAGTPIADAAVYLDKTAGNGASVNEGDCVRRSENVERNATNPTPTLSTAPNRALTIPAGDVEAATRCAGAGWGANVSNRVCGVVARRLTLLNALPLAAIGGADEPRVS